MKRPARTRASHSAAAVLGPLSIGALSRATQIPIATLRTWERRYGVPAPERKPSGHRVYAAATVDHLRRVGRLLAQGHRPAEVLTLAPAELEGLLAMAGALNATEPPVPSARSTDDGTLDPSLAELMRSTRLMDPEALRRELGAQWARLGPLRFMDACAGPLLRAIGAGWRDGTVGIRHEHAASACVADFLREVRGPFEARARGPRVVAAMLPGETHEGGLLMASVVLSMRGLRVVYLGANTPVREIAAAAHGSGIEAVAISLSEATETKTARRELARLRKALPRRMPIWAGGTGLPAAVPGVERFESFTLLDARLARRG